MIKITRSFKVDVPEVALSDFIEDLPFADSKDGIHIPQPEGVIDGMHITPLQPASDSRGSLSELLTTRGIQSEWAEPIVHVYQVTAKPDSRRAWFYHRWQSDRLAFTNGYFRVVLYDLRPDSLTFGLMKVLVAGIEQPMLLHIPPLVAHGVHNNGSEIATFTNMPTKTWNPERPDKMRLPEKDPRIPFDFDA